MPQQTVASPMKSPKHSTNQRTQSAVQKIIMCSAPSLSPAAAAMGYMRLAAALLVKISDRAPVAMYRLLVMAA